MTEKRDVYYMPPTIHDTEDPSKIGRKEDETSKGSKYWEEKEKEAAARARYEESERAIREGRERDRNPPEPPFQIKGSVNLGDIDLQKNNAELQNTILSIQKDARDREDKLNAQAADYRDKVAEIRYQMTVDTMKAAVENTQKMYLESKNANSNEAIMGRFNEIIALAQAMGYSKPDPAATPDLTPPAIQLQMLKMEMEEKGRQRQFEWDKIESERNWQIAIKKLELEADARKQEIILEREKRASFISPFESIGAALARGLSDMGNENEQPPPSRVQKQSKKKTKENYQLQAGENDSGTIACPECQEPIAIAPKSKSAFCPSCEANISIERIADAAPPSRGLV